MHFRGADLEVAFYQVSLPAALRPFFCLPGVWGRHLSAEAAKLVGDFGDNEPIHVQARVVPMGWGWATYFVQHAGLHILHKASDAEWLYDRLPGGSLKETYFRALYIDNFMSVGLDLDKVKQSTEQMIKGFS